MNYARRYRQHFLIKIIHLRHMHAEMCMAKEKREVESNSKFTGKFERISYFYVESMPTPVHYKFFILLHISRANGEKSE